MATVMITKFLQDWETETLGGHKALYSTGPRGKEQWCPQKTECECWGVSGRDVGQQWPAEES